MLISFILTWLTLCKCVIAKCVEWTLGDTRTACVIPKERNGTFYKCFIAQMNTKDSR